LSSAVATGAAATGDAQFLVTSFDGFSVFTAAAADDVSKPDTNDASAENKYVTHNR